MPVRDTSAMIAQMSPVLQPGTWYFCTLPDSDPRATTLMTQALSTYREAEGISLLLSAETCATEGLTGEGPMAWIQLDVLSSLDGIGLTAAVSTVLAEAQIPCNVIAAYHHDHVLVPSDRAEEAVAHLQSRAASEQ